MYCPRCAAPSIDDAKFCRACGADLKAVALALAGQNLPAKGGKNKTKSPKAGKSPEEKRSKGVRDAIEGATLLGGSLLICLAINLLSNYPDRMALMGLWAVFFGWMACWGVFAIASGLGAITESKTMRSQPGNIPDTSPLNRPSLSPPPSVTEYASDAQSVAPSVTEDTTRSFEPVPK